VGSRGVICDLGCGPGQIARYLADRGASVVGVDLSDGMLAQARRLNPDVVFQQGDMRALTTVRDGAWAGIAAFYSIIHIPRAQLTAALTELRRVLQPGGLLLLAFHLGQGELHLDTWWDRPVNAEFIYFQTAEMRQALEAAGFAILEAQEREPRSLKHRSASLTPMSSTRAGGRTSWRDGLSDPPSSFSSRVCSPDGSSCRRICSRLARKELDRSCIVYLFYSGVFTIQPGNTLLPWRVRAPAHSVRRCPVPTTTVQFAVKILLSYTFAD